MKSIKFHIRHIDYNKKHSSWRNFCDLSLKEIEDEKEILRHQKKTNEYSSRLKAFDGDICENIPWVPHPCIFDLFKTFTDEEELFVFPQLEQYKLRQGKTFELIYLVKLGEGKSSVEQKSYSTIEYRVDAIIIEMEKEQFFKLFYQGSFSPLFLKMGLSAYSLKNRAPANFRLYKSAFQQACFYEYYLWQTQLIFRLPLQLPGKSTRKINRISEEWNIIASETGISKAAHFVASPKRKINQQDTKKFYEIGLNFLGLDI
jgi:hypothetical protein